MVGNFVGNPSMFNEFRHLFVHIPHSPQRKLPQFYGDADVFVFPTLLEGLGLVVLEAMASGLPVITTARGPDEVVRDGIDGFVVPIRDADAIAERLRILQCNPDLRAEMGRRARERAMEFSWDAYTDRVLTAMREVRDK